MSAELYDATDRPTPGTECVQCREVGHFCPAKGYAGELPLCEACGTGQKCMQVVSVEKFRSGQRFDEFEAETLPSECRTIAIADADRVVEEKPIEQAWTVKASLDPANLLKVKQKKRIAPKPQKARAPRRQAAQPREKEKVMDDPVAKTKMELSAAKAEALRLKDIMSAAKIAVKIGWAQPTVSRWFRDAAGKPTKKKTKSLKPLAPIKPLPPIAKVPEPVRDPETISLQAPVGALDRFWAKLTIPEKTRIVERELFGGW